MKTVLAYGDSLTWGRDAATAGRHAYADRWPTRLATGLGEDVLVIVEGLNGRTTAYDDPTIAEERNGATILPTLLATHQPLDLIVILLGTNDFKRHTGGGNAYESKLGMQRLVQIVRGFDYVVGDGPPDILLVSPPTIRRGNDPRIKAMLGEAGPQSQRLPDLYRELAAETSCHHFDAASVCETTLVDGIHLDAENSRRLGDALVPVVKHLLEARPPIIAMPAGNA
ncbi:SGNH/GDSL hydrolase family protein [Aurantimonas sp. MSK8Z-1]|uniref:SGNH/GDSL hydrolase family protein n=1 Tax=Mangrovibrevibacter kandeliae TaxID=2968473 RepID=UPI002117F2EE|nr:SGNH/GDSL hydrolase family protein [Aurantimonas sp. MSK8Z-1]MCW4114591.1 SGNH/GDSL hydrolase family protein [Aurantimonas sp. MSK8Z-1]